ncbi:MAG TPA: AbrB/MazE/SpoVT family DNA-binding domain-containing protein [Rhizomicrobium sp.]|nr:AbrB/MazE/SpoVT family DNA-binding domain-containing protein [Rhizomicrobium sp.]
MTTMTSKGQVTVPKRLRDAAGLKPGSRVSFELQDGCILLKRESRPAKSRFAKVRGDAENAEHIFICHSRESGNPVARPRAE